MPFGAQPVHRWPVLNSESDVVRLENVHSGSSVLPRFHGLFPHHPQAAIHMAMAFSDLRLTGVPRPAMWMDWAFE
jgi:hypothetical protein